MSKALGAVNCQVDPSRLAQPISGRAIRADAYAHRQMIHPLVYRDLITHVVFLGAPSTGKSHLLREEERLTQANRFLFTDTNALTTCLFAQYYHGAAEPRLAQLAAEAVTRYDLVFLCGAEIPYDDSWDRSGDVWRQVFQRQTEADLIQRRVPYLPLSGSLSERIARVEDLLGHYRKYRSVGELITGR